MTVATIITASLSPTSLIERERFESFPNYDIWEHYGIVYQCWLVVNVSGQRNLLYLEMTNYYTLRNNICMSEAEHAKEAV